MDFLYLVITMKRTTYTLAAMAAIAMMSIHLSSCDYYAKAETPYTVYLVTEKISALSTSSYMYVKQTVYICTGPQSKRFHKTSHCRGLNSCSGDVVAVTISKATSLGRTPCKWCYK